MTVRPRAVPAKPVGFLDDIFPEENNGNDYRHGVDIVIDQPPHAFQQEQDAEGSPQQTQ